VSLFGRYKQIFTTHFSNLKILEFTVLVINLGHGYEAMERYFEKREEDFVKNIPNNKNLSHFYTTIIVWEI
jgi:hypothetical protein